VAERDVDEVKSDGSSLIDEFLDEVEA